MVNVSESRPRTTPLNFTFAPFGMDCAFEGCFFVAWAPAPCPKTCAAANKRARPPNRLNDRIFLSSPKFILASSLTDGECNRALRRSVEVKQFRLTGGRKEIVTKTGTEINGEAPSR